MKINKQKLLQLYLIEIDRIGQECDWKISFSAEECVNLVVKILENNKDLIEE